MITNFLKPPEAIGKIVVGITVCDEHASVRFSDGSAIVIHAYSAYEGDNSLQIVESVDRMSASERRAVDLLSLEEHQREYAEERAKEARHKDMRDRQEYERLKRRFESEPKP